MTDPVAETIAAYDVVASDYARRNAVAPDELLAHQRAFVHAVGAGALVADVGCGFGRDASWFTAHGLRVVGFDRSRQMLARASAAGVPLAYADLRVLPVGARALDGLWSAASLLHVPRDDAPAALREWHRALRPGGIFGLSTSQGSGDGWEAARYDTGSGPRRDGVRRWFVHHERDALLALVTAAGFEVTWSGEHAGHRRWLQLLAVTR